MRRLLALLAGACLLLPADGANVRHAQGALVVNSDGSYNEQYPTGDKPPDGGVLDFTSAGQSVLENVGTVTVSVARTAGSTNAASVTISNAGTGTATSSDWTSADLPTTLNWTDGDSASKSTTIHITNRSSAQGTRTLVLQLGSFSGAVAGTTNQTYTITIGDASQVTTQKKWHPGYYLTMYRNNSYEASGSAAQTLRFGVYDGEGSNTHIQGWHRIVKWSELESTQGNYSAGDSMLLSEIAHLKAESHPMRFSLQLMDEPNTSYCNSQACWQAFFPSYMQSTCIGYGVDSTGTQNIAFFRYHNTTCVGYLVALLQHLGSLLDSESYFENITIDYEQAVTSTDSTFNRTAFYNGITSAVQAAAAAFPHTNISFRANWGVTYHEADVAQLLTIMKTNGVGWGDQDACSRMPDSPFSNIYGTMPSYIDADNIFAGYGGFDTGHNSGTYTDQRLKMFGFGGVETSELGYNSVCNGQGFAGYASVANGLRAAGYMSLFDWWDVSMKHSHANVEYNTYAGTAVQQWSVGTTGSLWDMVTNHPLTHTACPTDYDTLFGDGTVGSGCNTN